MTASRFFKGLRAFGRILWYEPGSRRVIEFFLIIGIFLVLPTVVMGNRAYDSITPIAAVTAVIAANRMNYWNVRNRHPIEAIRSITVEPARDFTNRCIRAAASLRYESGWKSDRHSLHFSRGDPPILPQIEVCREEIWVTFPNLQGNVELKARTWTNSRSRSSDPATKALQEFYDVFLNHVPTNVATTEATYPLSGKRDPLREMRTRKIWVKTIALLAGILTWVVCGVVGLLLTVGQGDSWLRDIGSWVGLFLCAWVFELVSRVLEKKWERTRGAA